MTYTELLGTLAAKTAVICGDTAHRVQYNLFGSIEVFDMMTDTAEPLRILHLKMCRRWRNGKQEIPEIPEIPAPSNCKIVNCQIVQFKSYGKEI